MNRLDRRGFLRLAAYAAAAVSTLRFGAACSGDDPIDRMFPQGVASGDPTVDGVLLWTRVDGVRQVRYEVATDEQFTAVVVAGDADADPERDHTVRLDITGLGRDRPHCRERPGAVPAAR